VLGACDALSPRALVEERARCSLHQMRADVWVAAAKVVALERFAAALFSQQRWCRRALDEARAAAATYGVRLVGTARGVDMRILHLSGLRDPRAARRRQ